MANLSAVSRHRGAITLVALCFVTVMGIALASYIAVCSRAMNLSNRTFHSNLSRQLAEMGIDEALRAFNKGDWGGWAANPADVTGGTTAWTLDTTNKRATRTITFNSPKFSQGVSATVKIRVDNYDATQLNSTWSSAASYRVGDTIGYNGIWYGCVKNHSNQVPNGGISNYWAPESTPWTWNSTTAYAVEQLVNYNGYWYRCSTSNTNSTPTGAASSNANWTYIAAIMKDNTSGVFGVQDAVVNWFGTWYRWNSPWDNLPPLSWRWRNTGVVYSFNDTVCYGNVWYRYVSGTPTSSGASYSAPSIDTTRWATVSSMWGWSSSSINYNSGDVVFYSSTNQWYRCIRGHTSSGSLTPANSTYWVNSPLFSTAWEPNRQYSQNDTVRYQGVWYRYISGSPSSGNLPTNTTYWIGANTGTASYQWDAATAYAVGDYRCYGGAWYKCIAATTANAGHTPNNTSYWTAAWANSFGVTTGASVVYAEGSVTIEGSPPVRTQLRATISPASLFPNAVGATTTLFASSGGTVDSYDSVTDPSASSPGYSAVVAAGNSTTTAVTLSGAVTVSGYVAATSSTSSPFAPLFTYGTSTVVKGTAATPSPKVDLSRLSRSPVIPQFDPLPSGGLTAAFAAGNFPKGLALPAASTVNIGTAGASTPSRYHYNGNLVMGGGSSVIQTLNINGPVILYINGNLTMTGSPNGIININPAGSAEIHVAGALAVDSGSEGIRSYTSDPKSCILICDTATSATQVYSEDTNPYYGVIYIPNTTASYGLFFNNGESYSSTVYGAVSARAVAYQNNINLHYDTSLRYATFGGVDQPYTVDQWRELPVTELATMP